MATIGINAPSNLSMNDFWANSEDKGGPIQSCRFGVVIRPVGSLIRAYAPFSRDLFYLCEIAELPGKGFQNAPVRYYGHNINLPVSVQFEEINLTFICRQAFLERQFFDDWMTIINPPNTFDLNYRDDYRAEIEIFQFDNQGTAQYSISLQDAWPVLVNPQPMTWGDDNFQRVVVAFSFSKWIRKGIDPEPRSGQPQGFSFKLVEDRDVNR